MIRGLFCDWKQPIYVGFDVSISLALLNDVMSKVYASGFEIVATTSDCGGGNVSIWSGVNLQEGRTYLRHPMIHLKMFMFADGTAYFKVDWKLASRQWIYFSKWGHSHP